MASLREHAVVLGLVLSTTAGIAAAQVADKPSLTLDGAETVIAGAMAEAKRVNAPGGVIAVVDDGGNLIAVERIDGTFAAGANISIGKARTAVLFKKPTKVFEDIINKGRTAMTALSDFTPLQGGVPIEVDGKDIIYVLDGSATFVTGGTMVDGEPSEPDEIRGTAVTGGDTRRIAKGDVIIVPNGTPHWFQEVPGPLTYYVVKVR